MEGLFISAGIDDNKLNFLPEFSFNYDVNKGYYFTIGWIVFYIEIAFKNYEDNGINRYCI